MAEAKTNRSKHRSCKTLPVKISPPELQLLNGIFVPSIVPISCPSPLFTRKQSIRSLILQYDADPKTTTQDDTHEFTFECLFESPPDAQDTQDCDPLGKSNSTKPTRSANRGSSPLSTTKTPSHKAWNRSQDANHADVMDVVLNTLKASRSKAHNRSDAALSAEESFSRSV